MILNECSDVHFGYHVKQSSVSRIIRPLIIDAQIAFIFCLNELMNLYSKTSQLQIIRANSLMSLSLGMNAFFLLDQTECAIEEASEDDEEDK